MLDVVSEVERITCINLLTLLETQDVVYFRNVFKIIRNRKMLTQQNDGNSVEFEILI
ncbi:hypothetical protein [Candidatus Hodgkinia cicadicola]|uniref:hypothetical protein n=1 Tax=Candidatus Hodgkinia cicadicola TaxID=573658 RepID=UPI001788B4E8